MIKTEELMFGNFGRCLKMTNGKIEAYITLDLGPRIIKFNCVGMNNMMFTDEERQGTADVSSVYGEGERWYSYGGHRFWVTPEEMPLTYYPDNHSVEYVVETDGVRFIPGEQKINKVREEIKCIMDDDNGFSVIHSLTNTDDKVRRGGIWGITVSDKNGIAVLKQPERNSALLPDRVIAFWPYTKMKDERLLFGDDYIAVQQSPAADCPAKIGINSFERKIYCFNHGQLLTITYEPDGGEGEYPDFGVSCEIYTNERIIELETLGKLKDIKSGETITHTEKWFVSKCDFKPSLDEREIAKAFEAAGL